MLRKPKVCIEERCGTSCDMHIVEMMLSLYKGDPHKCPLYERNDLLYEKTKQEKIKKEVYKEIESAFDDSPPDIILKRIKEIINH